MAIKSCRLKVTLVILSIVIVLGVVAVGLFILGVFPAFNEKIRHILWPTLVQEERLRQEQQEELLRQQTSIRGLHPHLLETKDDEVYFEQAAVTWQWAHTYSCPDSYSLHLLPILEAGDDRKSGILAPGATAPVLGKPLWTYAGVYPLVSQPGIFYDVVVFIDAQPALVCLDKSTGEVLMRIPCQVFPGTEGFSHLKSYYFKARGGQWYQIRFEEGNTPPESLLVSQAVAADFNFEQQMYGSLLPGRNSMDFINAKMNGLLSVTPSISVPGGTLYSLEDGPLAFDREIVSPAFVFSPREQGTYILGLCNQEGGWIRDNGFVVLYTMSGEALAISLDYVADRPQITTHLSNQELYVACVGFFPDSLIFDAGLAQDFRDNPEITSAAELPPMEMEVSVLDASNGDSLVAKQAWFQVKRAP